MHGSSDVCPASQTTEVRLGLTAGESAAGRPHTLAPVNNGFAGLGTVINVVAILLGGGLGMVLGHRLPERVRSVVTDGLGLVTLLVAALSAYQVTSPDLEAALGTGVPVLLVLASLLIGGIAGSLLRLEERLGALASIVQRYAARLSSANASGALTDGMSARERFIEGWLSTSLLFCVGPLAILGPLSDGLGRGIDQLVLKSSLDLFAAMAFAASFGLGVLFSAVSVAVVQGLLTVVGVAVGSVISEAQVAALSAVGGLLLIGLALRLLRVREVPVADLLPALVVAPFAVAAVSALLT